MYWNPEIETLDARSIAKLQSRKLRAMLRQAYLYHPHYRRVMQSLGIFPHDIETPGELRRLPFTTQADLAAAPESFVLPLPGGRKPGRLSARMQVFYDAMVDGNKSYRKIYEYHPVMAFEASGRRSPPYRVYMAAFDKAIFKELCGRAATCAGLSNSDRVLNLHPCGRGIAFWTTIQGSLSRGACCSSPGQPGPQEDAAMCPRFRPTVIAGSPLYVSYVAQAADRLGIRMESVEQVFLSGCPADARLKDTLGKQLLKAGASPALVDLYSVTEARHALAECVPGSGYHTSPDVHVWECVDPRTGEPVGPGEPGELAFTSIDGRGSVFLRYRTGDLAEGGIIYGKCPDCGRTMPRIVGPLKRLAGGPDPGEIARKLMDMEGIGYASVQRAPAGSRAQLLIYAMPEDGTAGGDLARRILEACDADEATAAVRIGPR